MKNNNYARMPPPITASIDYDNIVIKWPVDQKGDPIPLITSWEKYRKENNIL